jgi:hypothetical protein
MRKITYILCFAMAALAIGCTSQIPINTPEDQAAACIQSVTTARKAATVLLRAGKISLARDQEVQDALNTAAQGCREMAPK